MNWLRLISASYFRRHVVRTMLTTGGIVLGVALFVAMHAANRAVLAGFADTVDKVAGKTQLQVSAGEAGFGEDVLDRVQSARTVSVAVPALEVVVSPRIEGESSLLVLGTDLTGDRNLRDYDLEENGQDVIDDPLVFLAQPDSLIISTAFAARHHLTSGAHLTLGTVEGDRTLTIRGIVKTPGLASAFGGNVAIMDIYAAQKMFGRGRTFDRIDLAVKDGVTLAQCQQELREVLGPGFEIQSPATRGQQLELMLSSYSTLVGLSSAFALFIGIFIIYNAFSVAIVERRGEIGILRALGMTRGRIRGVFLAESAIIGLVGSVIGVGVGVVIARGIAVAIAGLLSDVYRLGQSVDAVTADPRLLVGALAIGIATSLIAGVVPAWRAADVEPIEALRKGRVYAPKASEFRIRAGMAAALAAAGVVCLLTGTSRLVFYAGYACAILAAVVSGPALTAALSRVMAPLLRRVHPVAGTLAADSLVGSPRRTSAAVSALMFSLALVIAFEGMGRANYQSMVDWMDAVLNAELFVLPSQNLELRSARFPPVMAGEIAEVPGVERVQMLRNARSMFRDTPVMLVAMEMGSIGQTVHRRPVSGGTAEEMFRKAAAHEGVLVSDNLAQLQHLALGDRITLAAPYGVIDLPIVGIVIDYSDQQGSILLDRDLYVEHWHDESVNMFRVYTKRGVPIDTVRQAIGAHYAGKRQVFVLTNPELKAYISRILDRWFALTSLQVFVAVAVAILGIVNMLTVSIADRRREIGVLRAIGSLHGQIRRSIWLEGITVGVFGLILGMLLGAFNLYYVLEMVHRDVTGMRLPFEFPLMTAGWLVPTIAGAAFLASIWPAEAAIRSPLVEAIEYE